MHTSAVVEGATPLNHWSVIRVQGADAANFLHQQLSQDMLALSTEQARLAAYCTAKGRMLASFLVLRLEPDVFLLLCSADLAQAMTQRLRMYVLRSKVTLDDPGLALHGLIGAPAQQAWGGKATAWATRRGALGWLLALPAARLPGTDSACERVVLIGEPLPTPAPAAVDPGVWDALEIMSGVPRIEAVNSEQFVPQMINFDLVGGINFKKGCYPGQEIVARSHYLGTLKRRTFVFSATQAVSSGQEVFHDSDPAQPCGRVVNAAPAPRGGYVALVEIKWALWSGLASKEAGVDTGVHVGASPGVPLHPEALPYEVGHQETRERQLMP